MMLGVGYDSLLRNSEKAIGLVVGLCPYSFA